jgi:hypothetical protein
MPAWIGSALLKYLIQPILTYLILPLLQAAFKSALWAWEKWRLMKEAERIVDKDKEKYEGAKTPEEQENAFEDSLRNPNNRT